MTFIGFSVKNCSFNFISDFLFKVMPGLLLCFVMRYDNYKKQAATAADMDQSKITYFHCSLIGYIVGKILITSLHLLAKNV